MLFSSDFGSVCGRRLVRMGLVDTPANIAVGSRSIRQVERIFPGAGSDLTTLNGVTTFISFTGAL